MSAEIGNATPADGATPDSRRRRFALWRVGLAVVAALALLALAVPVAPMLLEGNPYASVETIERAPTYRDAALLQAAWRLPAAAEYARHAFEYQRNQSFCGPTSVADVLHSLGGERSQEEMLADTPFRTWFGYLPGGLTLDQEADLLRRRTGRPVKILRGLTLDEFRNEMRGVNDAGRRTIANFHRGPLFGRGHGHFSPLLGYLADRDLVLVGDVNANFRPFLAPTERLWRATRTIDAATGQERGLAVIETAPPL